MIRLKVPHPKADTPSVHPGLYAAGMPCATLSMSIEHSAPAITRTVVVPADITLNELHEVICTTFDFSGLQEHHFASDHEMARGPWSEAQEMNTTLPGLLVAPLGTATYHYGDNDDWTVTIENLGFPHERMLVPKLIDAAGPDILEGCGGPAQMTAMRDCAVRAVAQLNLDLEIADLITALLPGLAPELVIQRLTHTDPATVATRVSYSMPPNYIDGLGQSGRTHGDGTRHDPLSHPEDWPEQNEPELEAGLSGMGLMDPPEQLPAEDRQELNAQMIEEIQEALRNVSVGEAPEEETAGTLDAAAAEEVTEPIRWLLDYVDDGLPLTQAGYLKPVDVVAVAEHLELEKYWLGKLNREAETAPVRILREALIHLKLLRITKRTLQATRLGRDLKTAPLDLARYIAAGLPLVYDVAVVPAMQRLYLHWYHGDTFDEQRPEGYADNRFLLLAMKVLDRDAGRPAKEQATPAGRSFISEVLGLQQRD